MKARMVSRLESTDAYYEFFNTTVEIHLGPGVPCRNAPNGISLVIAAAAFLILRRRHG
jgi:hypothetical protein